MSRGSIKSRGPNTWRLIWNAPDSATGKRKQASETVHGSKKQAEERMTELLRLRDTGMAVAPDALTVADLLRGWLGSDRDLAPKTRERYRQLAEQQIIPHLGGVKVQALRPLAVKSWHTTLLTQGGAGERPLSARTVGHAHRVLHRAIQRLVEVGDILSRNVASGIKLPKVEQDEIEILTRDQIGTVLDRLADHPLYAIAATALATGMRRGEILALSRGALDLDRGLLRVERSLEETKAGLRFKKTKSRDGRGTLTIPGHLVEILRAQLLAQLELRMKLGMGRPGPTDLVFSRVDGAPYAPDTLSRDWWRVTISRELPRVSFHALRHTHASALIAAKMDIVAISKRLGHSSPAVTLKIYAHLFDPTDQAAADAIDALFRGR
jgi:integrase